MHNLYKIAIHALAVSEALRYKPGIRLSGVMLGV